MKRIDFASSFKGLPLVGFVVVAFLISAAFLLVRAPGGTRNPAEKRAQGQVSIVNLDGVNADTCLRLEALLRDPSPLFLPTEWNSSQAAASGERLPLPGDVFGAYPAKLVLGSMEAPVSLPPAVLMPASPVSEFSPLLLDRPFIGLGSRAAAAPVLQARALCIELRETASGRVLLREDVAQWPSALGDRVPWAPAEFLVATSESGLTGKPGLSRGSGVAEVDQLLAVVLQQRWPLLERKARLRPGHYRVVVGP